ncbi:ATP-dependent DNA helicase [Streptomyces sp. A0642]|uniref:ATP-dependent DNA helicase n=1 Tax=Streptomyces sp. A0642 TaxID=2563100 RepID=UPI0010A205B2|nr:ATP-dependent DNA helicase [Streptomyces sp. A0642]THA72436.1 ATP-dependent DNA helicase [Streptomyces sp. A0642]
MPASTPPTTFASAQTILAQRLPGYRRRPQQEALASAIEQTFSTGTHLLAEAGTGTGKSLGALIPAILAVTSSDERRRYVVATSTNALLTQYAGNDLPFLEKELGDAGVHFTWAPLKGIGNFLCLSKISESPRVENLRELCEEIAPDDNGQRSHTGDRNDVKTPLRPGEWNLLASTSSECPGASKCAMAAECFGMLHKAASKEADIVITNTAIVMTDVKLNRQIREGSKSGEGAHILLDQYDGLIIDEAHELQETATRFLGFELRQGGITTYLDQAASFIELHSDTGTTAPDKQAAVLGYLDSLGQIITTALDGEKTLLVDSAFIEEHAQLLLRIYSEVEEVARLVQKTRIEHGSNKKQSDTKERLAKVGQNLLAELKEILLADPAEIVRWAETYTLERTNTRTPEQTRWVIKTAPINVGPYLREELWDTVPAVLMSATMSAGSGPNRFDYIARTLGLEGAQTLDVGTPFDYPKQSLLYVPDSSSPSPNKATREAWATWVPEATMELIRAAGGGAMLLYTSRTSMETAHRNLAPRLAANGITSYIQGGDLTNKQIAERFRDNVDSVLFGLKSFMVGVDFPGRTCRLVVIDKLPFAVPTDPINAARVDALEAQGGNSFADLAIPEMTLTLQQAFGRLIRSVNDYGVVAIMDSRLNSWWGKNIVRSLPDAPVRSSFADVQTFFDLQAAIPAAA